MLIKAGVNNGHVVAFYYLDTFCSHYQSEGSAQGYNEHQCHTSKFKEFAYQSIRLWKPFRRRCCSPAPWELCSEDWPGAAHLHEATGTCASVRMVQSHEQENQGARGFFSFCDFTAFNVRVNLSAQIMHFQFSVLWVGLWERNCEQMILQWSQKSERNAVFSVPQYWGRIRSS